MDPVVKKMIAKVKQWNKDEVVYSSCAKLPSRSASERHIKKACYMFINTCKKGNYFEITDQLVQKGIPYKTAAQIVAYRFDMLSFYDICSAATKLGIKHLSWIDADINVN